MIRGKHFHLTHISLCVFFGPIIEMKTERDAILSLLRANTQFAENLVELLLPDGAICYAVHNYLRSLKPESSPVMQATRAVPRQLRALVQHFISTNTPPEEEITRDVIVSISSRFPCLTELRAHDSLEWSAQDLSPLPNLRHLSLRNLYFSAPILVWPPFLKSLEVSLPSEAAVLVSSFVDSISQCSSLKCLRLDVHAPTTPDCIDRLLYSLPRLRDIAVQVLRSFEEPVPISIRNQKARNVYLNGDVSERLIQTPELASLAIFEDPAGNGPALLQASAYPHVRTVFVSPSFLSTYFHFFVALKSLQSIQIGSQAVSSELVHLTQVRAIHHSFADGAFYGKFLPSNPRLADLDLALVAGSSLEPLCCENNVCFLPFFAKKISALTQTSQSFRLPLLHSLILARLGKFPLGSRAESIFLTGRNFPCLTSLTLRIAKRPLVAAISLVALPNLLRAVLVCTDEKIHEGPSLLGHTSISVVDCSRLVSLCIEQFSVSKMELRDLPSLEEVVLGKNYFETPDFYSADDPQRLTENVAIKTILPSLKRVAIEIAESKGLKEELQLAFGKGLCDIFSSVSISVAVALN